MKICPECGKENDERSKTCCSCGYPFADDAQSEHEALDIEKSALEAEKEAERLEKELAKREEQARQRKEAAERRKQEALKKLEAVDCGEEEQEDLQQVDQSSDTQSDDSEQPDQSPETDLDSVSGTCVEETNDNVSSVKDIIVSPILRKNENREKKSLKERFLKKKFVIPLVIVIALLIIAAFPKKTDVTGIFAEYKGNTEAGTVLDSSNDGFQVYGYLKDDGSLVDLSGWKIEDPMTLVMDTSSKVTVRYKSYTYDVIVRCTTSEVTGITAEYKGDTSEGTVIDNDSDIVITAKYKNGTEGTIDSGWKVKSPVTLEKDGKADVTVNYEGLSTTLAVICSTHTLESITVEYDGETKEGTVIDSSNDGIHVTGHFKNDVTEEIEGWEIKEPATLAADGTSKVTITYEDKSCELEVACSTVSEAKYKGQCESISYDNLARDPDTYDGRKVKFTGEVIQVVEGDYVTAYRIDVTKTRYGYTDTVYVVYVPEKGAPRILEDDIVTLYGEYTGLYSYESIMGATITIPSIMALYIDVN